MEELECLIGVGPVTGSEGILGHSDDGEAFGKYITALLDRLAVTGYGEEHMSVSVEAMGVAEVYAGLGSGEPLRVLLHIVVSIGADKSESALEPHGLGGIHKGSVPVKTSIDSPVLTVEAVLEPEWHNIFFKVRQIPVTAITDKLFLFCGHNIKCLIEVSYQSYKYS